MKLHSKYTKLIIIYMYVCILYLLDPHKEDKSFETRKYDWWGLCHGEFEIDIQKGM